MLYELNFKNMKKGAVYGNNEYTTEQLDEENLFNIINKILLDIIINKMKKKRKKNCFLQIDWGRKYFGNICFPIFEMCYAFDSNFVRK